MKAVTKQSVFNFLIKRGNSEVESLKMIEQEFEFVTNSYKDATTARVAEIIRIIY